jgi:gliding motility-associated-like protein
LDIRSKNIPSRRLTLLIVLLLYSFCGFSQLVVKKDRDAEILVQEVLIGNGITVSNITFQGNKNAVGFFDGTKSNIGLDSGMIFSTGNVLDAIGPNDQEDISSLNNEGGDADLESLSNGFKTYDAVSVEFDFIPIDNTVKFRFVFGSEEYYKFVNQGFNDVFGFFISGPGFSGKENIALVPGTNIPISISTINNTSNSQYIVDNANGATIQYNAFTKVIEITANVTACETYKIRFAISDVKDMAYDSGIFLEASSFSSNNKNDVELTATNFVTEGCDSLKFTLNRVSPDLSNSITVNYTISGTATNTLDYSTLPLSGSITIPAGQTDVTLAAAVIQDGIADGSETVIMDIDNPGICRVEQKEIVILEYAPLKILDVLEIDCQDSGRIVLVTFTGGSNVDNLTFVWTDSEGTFQGTGIQIKLIPDSTQWFYVEVEDKCSGLIIRDSILLDPIIAAEIYGLNDTTVCAGSTIQLIVTSNLPQAKFEWKASPATTLISPNNVANPTISNITSTTILIVEITNDSVCAEQKRIKINVPNFLLGSPVYFSCSGDSVELLAVGGEHYEWRDSAGDIVDTIPNPKVSPSHTTTYSVIISSGKCKDTLSTQVVVDISPEANAGKDTIVCGRQQVQLFGSGSPIDDYLWFPKNGLSDPKAQNPVANPTKTTQYILRAANNSCFDYDTITIFVVDSASANFTYNVDTCTRVVSVQNIGADSVFWDFGDGYTTTDKNPVHKYTEGGEYEIFHETNKGAPCSDNKKIKVSFGEVDISKRRIPDAFSPNGDGVNDVFTIIGGNSTCEIKRMLVYDRWGQIMFDSQVENSFTWDGTFKGKRVGIGAYVYYIEGNGFSEKDWIAVIY